jgi:hypothetical protein
MMTKEELDRYSQYIDRDRLEYIGHQQQLFDEARPTLFEQYPNEYVAFEDGQVLDHDVDRVKLAERIYARYGCRDLIMQRMTLEKTLYRVAVPQNFEVYAEQIELRISALEQELNHLKDCPTKLSPATLSLDEQPWWVKITGSCTDNPLFEDAVRYGQEWRNSVE